MKKKLLSVLLAIALLVSLLAGCGPAATNPTEPAESLPVSSTPVETTSPSPSVEPTPEVPSDYTDVVLDTSKDAGRLTVRYFKLVENFKHDSEVTNVGDCTVITTPDGKVMMIDCSNQNSFPEIDAYLTAMGIDHLDAFVMSHPHADHIGCFVKLASKYPIGHVYRNMQEYHSGSFQNAMTFIKDNNIPMTILHDGDTFMLGEHVQFTVYGPVQELVDALTKDVVNTNNCSLAMRMTYGESSFWFAGDTYVRGELAIVDKYGDAIQSDVIKMNHHGYDTSNHKDYVATLAPKVAVSMHESMTSKTVALRHYVLGAVTLYTCMDGTVCVSTTGDGTYEVQTQLIRDNTTCGEPAPDGHYSVK